MEPIEIWADHLFDVCFGKDNHEGFKIIFDRKYIPLIESLGYDELYKNHHILSYVIPNSSFKEDMIKIFISDQVPSEAIYDICDSSIGPRVAGHIILDHVKLLCEIKNSNNILDDLTMWRLTYGE